MSQAALNNKIKGNDVPGSGTYNPNNYDKRRAPSFTIGKQKRPKLNKVDPTIPGPAKYNMKSTLKGQRKNYGEATMAGSLNRNSQLGHMFGGNNSGQDLKTTFGISKRKPILNNMETPGPGEYETDIFWTRKPNLNNVETGYDNSNKKKQSNPNLNNLGGNNDPGNLEIEVVRMNSAPKFSFKGKRGAKINKENFRFPGPAQYYTDHNFMVGLSGAHHVIGTQARFKPKHGRRQKNGVPGVGSYSISKGLSSLGIKFAKSKRRPLDNVDPEIEVGPDTYDLKSTVPQLQPWEDKAMKEAGFKIALDQF